MDFNNSGIKSPFSPRVRQSIGGRRPLGLNTGKKNQRLLAWPREALSPSGSSPAPAGPVAARELTLPQTDLSHKADLVVLFYEDGSQMPSCIGVSPEGVVRYWRSVAQGGVYSDTGVELAGQECARLTPPAFDPPGVPTEGPTLALATTTCTVCLLTPKIVDGRPTVECRTLRPPSGWFGGIGRKVSLLFFGSMPAPPENKLVGIVGLSGGGWALVAAGPVLQVWRGAGAEAGAAGGAGAAGHVELRPLLLAPLQHKQQQPPGDQNSLEIIALDVRANGPSSLLLLIATINVAREPDMRYALATINVEEPSAPVVTSLVGIGRWREESPDPPRCLPMSGATLIYNNNYIATVTASESVEVIEVSGWAERVLGAAAAGPDSALVFSNKHGVLALRLLPRAQPDTSVCDSPMGSPCPSDMYEGNLSLYEIDPHEVSMLTTDACGKLKTAFLFHLRRDSVACRSIIDELFSLPPAAGPGVRARHERDVDASLDLTVVAIAKEMLDDIPAGDPRWKVRPGSATNIPLGSSSSLQILSQLRDKRRAFFMFLDFLRATGLWHRLQLVSRESGGGSVSTESVLRDLSSRLHAALALWTLHQGPDANIIDQAIYQVVCGPDAEWEEEEEVRQSVCCGRLAPGDVCLRRVSRVWRVLRALCAVPRAAAAPHAAQHAAPHAARHALSTLNVVNSVLSEVCAGAGCWAGSDPVLPQHLLPSLANLHRTALTAGVAGMAESELRAQVFEAGAVLAQLVLSDIRALRADPASAHVYERMRREAIQPFIDEGQKERAVALAEKFQDFDLLIEMCVKDDDIDRLCSLIDKYSNDGMAEKAFAYLYDLGGRSLGTLVRSLGERHTGVLRRWLGGVGERAPVLALLEMSGGRYVDAAVALNDCCRDQHTEMLVSKVTTMASLAKLCLVAAPEVEVESRESEEEERRRERQWMCVSALLAQCGLQAALPRDLRLQHGLQDDDCNFMPPEEVVQMYIDSESRSLTEYDYKKALDITDYIEDMELRDDLRLKVWCACILQDDWDSVSVGAPADEISTKTFFRLIDLVHIMGGDVAVLLPALEDILTARELAELVSTPEVRYILQYGYQCLTTAPTTPLPADS